MAHKDVVVHEEEEEEDLGTALQNIPIPLNYLEKLSTGPVYSVVDGLKEIIKDSNLLIEDSQEDLSHNRSIDLQLLRNSPKLPTATKEPSLVPKQSRNKRGRQKRVLFKSAACLFDSTTDKSCSHCGTRKTPLWREGPKGAGTLCNACGMRYRTGRLLPEYRPASSPDFKPNIHSNFHRKVMEIRSERNSPPDS